MWLASAGCRASGTGKLENACAVACLPLIRACLMTLRGDIATVPMSFQPPHRTSMTGARHCLVPHIQFKLGW